MIHRVQITIPTSSQGINTRAAAEIARCASRLASEVAMRKCDAGSETFVSAKSVLDLLMLAVGPGAVCELACTGDTAQTDLAVLERLLVGELGFESNRKLSLTDQIRERGGVFDLQAETKQVAIEELIQHLIAAGKLDAGLREEYIKAVVEREAKQTTGVGEGWAWPHGYCLRVPHAVVALARSTTGIEWNSLDDKPVRLVLLVLIQPSRMRERLLFMTLGGRVGIAARNSPSVWECLLRADAASVLQVFRDVENRVKPQTDAP